MAFNIPFAKLIPVGLSRQNLPGFRVLCHVVTHSKLFIARMEHEVQPISAVARFCESYSSRNPLCEMCAPLLEVLRVK